jgi:hypothetical protein
MGLEEKLHVHRHYYSLKVLGGKHKVFLRETILNPVVLTEIDEFDDEEPAKTLALTLNDAEEHKNDYNESR